ncbi:GEVED domain-containing protein [Epilithonimonas sp.]|uniref:GEVED domain-containing protein n=1 Tax=Epilithonimonas sp. TaxID=2894511 RepID=UPI00289B897C|nr:GEVED domain-containing protein [Epilithonimonas sp.]
MKKLLLSCFLALGIGANAQYNYTADPTTDANLIYFAATPTTTTGCVGGGLSQTGNATNTQIGAGINLTTLTDSDPLQTNNGQAATVTLSYKKTGTGAGTLYLVYFDTDAGGTTWGVNTIASASITSSTVTTCTTLTGTIPAGTLKLDGSKDYAYGYFFVRSSGNSTIVTADYKIVQNVVTTAPSCTTFTSPTNGAVISAGQPSITWTAAPTAVDYKLTIGTTSGGSEVFNGTVSGTSYAFPATVNTTYYAKVVPSNLSGDATGCTEITFSTNNTVSYCTASGPASAQYDKITNVTFANINNTSPGSTTPYPPGYEDFTSVVGNVNKESTYGLVVKSDRVYAGDVIRAFIDYNNNGTFGDAGELVATINVTANSTAYTSATTNIAIPATATEGTTRMRVLIYDSTATFTSTLATTGCGTAAYGQVEDYTLNIAGPVMAVSDVNKGGVKVYPNPFIDVLKISDVKGVKSVSINDVSGREVKSLAPAAELNLSNLKSGLYIVNLKMDDGSVKTFKAIKK